MSTYVDGIRLYSHLDQQQALEELLDCATEVHRGNVIGRCWQYFLGLANKGKTKEEMCDAVRRIGIVMQNDAILKVGVIDGRTYIAFSNKLAGLRQEAEPLGEDYSYTDAVSADTPDERAEMAARAGIWNEVDRSGKETRFHAAPIIAMLVENALDGR